MGDAVGSNTKGMKFVGGRLCLDFVNTGGARIGGKILRDKLETYEDLANWGQLAVLMSPGEARRPPRAAGEILARARNLREALYRIFHSVMQGGTQRSADLAILNQELVMAKSHQRLRHSAGAFAWNWEDSGQALDRIVWSVSLSAAELLTGGDLSALRQCGGDECGWLFLDTSRNHRRQWCDMRDCGNRAKVRRFRERRQRKK